MTLQQQIIKALGAKPQINAEEEIRRSVDFLKSYLRTYPFIKSAAPGNRQRITAIYCRTPALWCSGRRTRLPGCHCLYSTGSRINR